jgi:hypothetical protein
MARAVKHSWLEVAHCNDHSASVRPIYQLWRCIQNRHGCMITTCGAPVAVATSSPSSVIEISKAPKFWI